MALADDLLAGADAAAEYTGLTVRAIYHMVAEGELPVKKLGRRLYFRKSALDAAFAAGGFAAAPRPEIKRPELAQGHTVNTLASAFFASYGIAHGQTKVLARLCNLRRLDFPKSAPRGKGRLGHFSDDAALQLIVALTLNIFGVGPEDCIRIVEANEAAIAERPAEGLTLALSSEFTACALASVRIDGKVFEMLQPTPHPDPHKSKEGVA